jgi:hypothetical protein
MQGIRMRHRVLARLICLACLSRMKQGEVNRNANRENAYSPIIFPGYSLGDIGLRSGVRKCLI